VERLKIQLDRQKLLFDKNITDQATYDDTRLLHESVKTELEENEKAIELAALRVDEAMQRRKEHEQQMTGVDTPALMQPLIENIRVQENRIAQIGERRKLLVLKAPLAGKVSRIFHRTGETVLSGDPLLSITDARSERVLAYVDEGTARNIRIGDSVVVSSRDRPIRYASAKILRVNSKIEEFPIRLRRNPYLPQWGLSILVGNIPGDRFYPGEVLHLRIEPSSEDT
jgi:multidrug resistance efflux pump